ncbi:roadblock/LC7 domain-containing protein [Streptomyces triticirhizae]|uniref:Roadblock/LC7 domain-containing protein n=1 Tax=Streptomyces triticirhizae TaxID=2483353 RepID=A0A3M2KYT3_9ACTN|nr:roadblock/LC7 domain-containing protein [Streptomyces triticirhizae]RMI27478.1 roadblock/LC7 domain-containing protein [Streptomyces triticirhizae]
MALSTTLDWLLDDLAQRLPRVRHVLLLSSDGLVTSVSRGLRRSSAEHLAAVASGLHSLAKGVGEHFGVGDVRQTMIEFDDGVLFVTSAGDGSCLCVLTGADADVGQVGYEMTLLVNKVGEHMGLAAREAL